MTFLIHAIKIALMKRVAGLILLIFIYVFSLQAETEPWSVNTVVVGIGNDKYANGFSRNDDDQLSFSEHLFVGAERWYVELNFNAITNRGWKNGWNIESPTVEDISTSSFYSGRLDVAELIFALKYKYEITPGFSVRIKPETGLYLSGSLGYDYLQNAIHKMSRIHSVDLPYDYSGVKAHYYIGAEADGVVDIADTGLSTLAISLGGSAGYATLFEGNERVEAKLFLYDEFGEILSLSLYWNWNQDTSGSRTKELYSRYINGPGFSALIDTGFFRLYYTAMIKNHFGYCVMSFDAMSFFKEPTWKENDLFFSVGKSRMMGLSFNEAEIEMPITSSFSLVLSNRFVAGYPIDKNWEKDADLRNKSRIKQGHTMFTINGEYAFPIAASSGWLTPYVRAGFGVMRWTLTYLSNMLPSSPVPSYTVGSKDGTGPDYSFVLDALCGIKIIPEGFIKTASTSFSLSLFVALSYVTGDYVGKYRAVASTKSDVWGQDIKSEFIDNIMFRYGFTINFGFDI